MTIQKDIEYTLKTSQNFPFNLNAKRLTEQWYAAKLPFIKLFGDTTILKVVSNVKANLSSSKKKEKFNDFINTLEENNTLNKDFKIFLLENERGFFDNRVLLPDPSRNITIGSKLSKSFRKFFSNEESLRWVQDTASRFMQEDKIAGNLYFSVDPQDFLTISENNENWTSCSSLTGDYKNGTLSYMVDNTTFIVFLADDIEAQELKCGACWNSKKWRMLVHTDLHHSIYYDKGYPYENRELINLTHQALQKLLPTQFDAPQDYGFKIVEGQWNRGMLVYNQLNAGSRTFDTRDIIDTSDLLGYCDLQTSSTYAPIVALNSDVHTHYTKSILREPRYEEERELFSNLFSIKIGERPYCPVCGNERLEFPDSFLCKSCSAEYGDEEDYAVTCDKCHNRLYDNEIIWYQGKAYCSTCYNERKIKTWQNVAKPQDKT
jgi:hypothetical protein